MGELINFRDYRAKIENEFQEFLTEMDKLAQINERSLEEELADLNPIDQEYYHCLLFLLEKLNQWEATAKLQHRKGCALHENSNNRKDAKRQRFGR